MAETTQGLRSPKGLLSIMVLGIALLGAGLWGWLQYRKQPIEIGAIVALSGSASHLVDVRDGMLLAVDDVNAWGGINGRKLQLILEDSKSDPEEAVRAFERIEAARQPVAYVSTLSAISLALAPMAEDAKVPLTALVTAAPELTERSTWVFRYYSVAQDEVPPIIHILKTLKIKDLGIVYLDDAFGISVAGLLTREFEAIGGTTRKVAFKTNVSDFAATIQPLTSMQAIYVVGFTGQIRSVFRQLREEHYPGYLLGASGVASLDTTAPELQGAYFTAPIIYNPNFPFANTAQEKYEAAYPKPFTHYAANGYDFVKLLASLLEGREVSRDSIRSALEQGFMYPGVFGDIHVAPGEHDIRFPLHPAHIVDGNMRYLR